MEQAAESVAQAVTQPPVDIRRSGSAYRDRRAGLHITRAAALLVALETTERKIMTTERQKEGPSVPEVKAILDEMVRAELCRIIDGFDTAQPRTNDAVDLWSAVLEAEIAVLKESARLTNY